MCSPTNEEQSYINELNTFEDTLLTENSSVLIEEDPVGVRQRSRVRTGLAKAICTPTPLEASGAVGAKLYNQSPPRSNYNWNAIAKRLHAPSKDNDDRMAQTIESHQSEYKETSNDDEINIDGKLDSKTIEALNIKHETIDQVNSRFEASKAQVEFSTKTSQEQCEQCGNSSTDQSYSQNYSKPHLQVPTKHDTEIFIQNDLQKDSMLMSFDVKTSQSDQNLGDNKSSYFHETASFPLNFVPDSVLISEAVKLFDKEIDQTGRIWKKLNLGKENKTKFLESFSHGAIEWNDAKFQSIDETSVNKTWQKVAKSLNVSIQDILSKSDKIRIVLALTIWQNRHKLTPDGKCGIACSKKLESSNNYLACEKTKDFNERYHSILSFIFDGKTTDGTSNTDKAYLTRHALYITEFMRASDRFDYQRRAGSEGITEQLEFELVRKMILDDLESNRRDNIGLLSLWIGIAKWGVSGVNIPDPVENHWRGPNSKQGKRMREYEQGGVGIADYDDVALARFYERFGTPDNLPMKESKYVKATEKRDKNNTVKKDKDGNILYTYTAVKYDSIKSNHEWYEYISKHFDKAQGNKPNDRWNDEASIWLLRDWIDNYWNDGAVKQYEDLPTRITASRIKNSGGVTLLKSDNIDELKEKYNAYGNNRKDRNEDDYGKRLNYTERLIDLIKLVKEDYKNGYRVNKEDTKVNDKTDKSKQ